MEGLAGRMVEHVDADVVIDGTGDRCEGLPGADSVITAKLLNRPADSLEVTGAGSTPSMPW